MREASYRTTALVGLGWLVTVVAAVIAGAVQSAGEQTCDDATSWCLTPGEAAVLGLALASPVLLAMIIIVLVLAGPFARRLPSAPLAGTLTAVVAVPVAGALGGLVLAVAR
ncbi:hypothetical protein GCM10010112_16130 [Actinoplanes lobatus]|uniref:FtsH-binding integral membrane protein n=1 Tax=Actinoplanes lobatus TaxID=113568 RepID=A0A7W7HMW0_9ACTN|nr:hypothetical protein [Actinoplanes lobatus]MBB4753443.1 FtsH-binding integral membrane protein [Actinoplanes lobatus]GGN60169.1 hypothetical protein GCM10010112_16130 [Actinoplanes lobatus]GIE37975.1 hypothetical protein Alo02nite_08730 [Actinoplanes lobatus]